MTTPKPEKLHLTTKLAYGAGDFGPAVTANILVFYLLFFFTDVAGLPAGLAGSVLMIGKISDAINDPIIGVLSDRTRSRWGRRLPWMLAGIIPFALLYVLQWIVPQFSDNVANNIWGLFAYYVLIGIVFNIAFTMVNLPYTALTPELTQDYNERTRLNSFRFAFSIGGSILSFILFILISADYANDLKQGFFILGLACAVLSIVALLWCILRIQERGSQPILNASQKKVAAPLLMTLGSCGIVYAIWRILPIYVGKFDFICFFSLLLGLMLLGFGLTLQFSTPEPYLIDEAARKENAQAQTAPSLTYWEQLRIVFSNRPFLFVIGIYLCSWLGVQLTASILVFFVVNWMGLTENESGFVALAVQGTALVMLFVWQALSQSLDKKVVYFLGMGFWIIAQIGLFRLQPGQIVEMYLLAILAGFGVSVAYLIPWSMVPDVIDLDELQTGKRREGIFYAFMVLLQKFGLALGLFLVGIVLEAAGFVARVAGEPIPTQPASALLAIRVAVGPLPAVVLILGLVLAYFYPITREIHAEIRLKLQEKQETDL